MHVLTILLASVLTVTPATAPTEPVLLLDWDEVSRRAHDPDAFTQGLLLDLDGRLFESTGLRGESSIREVDPLTGTVLRSSALPDDWFGEGLALVGDELIQLTWTEGIATRRDKDSFEVTTSHAYDGQGWGLCHDGSRLVMSDGSDELTFRDPGSFEPMGSVSVTIFGEPLFRLNELECVDGSVWANVWRTDAIVRIDPDHGRVTGVLDLRGLIEPHPAATDPRAVLNGIAWDATSGTFLLTGKDWPEMIEIQVREPGT